MKDRIIIATALIVLAFVALAGYIVGVQRAQSLEPRVFINYR